MSVSVYQLICVSVCPSVCLSVCVNGCLSGFVQGVHESLVITNTLISLYVIYESIQFLTPDGQSGPFGIDLDVRKTATLAS